MQYDSIDILLVEDNMDDAEIAFRELKKGHLANNLFHVKSGQEAISFVFAQKKYEKKYKKRPALKVILLDINMPGISGTELLQQLKNDETTRDIPVIMLTSSRETEEIQKCYDLGASSYIIKPLNFDAFAHAVKDFGFFWLLLNEAPTTRAEL